MNSLRIGATNFGPIAGADVELRRLSVFVGPNITGKSYMAQLIYAIAETSRRIREDFAPFEYARRLHEAGMHRDWPNQYPRFRSQGQSFDDHTLRSLQQLLPPSLAESSVMESPRAIVLEFDALPAAIQARINESLASHLDLFTERLLGEIERCYDAKISSLVSKLGDKEELAIRVTSEGPRLDLGLRSSGNKLEQLIKSVSLEDQTIEIVLPPSLMRRVATIDDAELWPRVLNYVANRVVSASEQVLEDVFPRRCFYLPAARSGILHGQKALARVGLRTLERAGIEPISIPRLPGVIIDFLDAIYSIDKYDRGDFYRLAAKLERESTPGRIEFIETKRGLHEIFYREPHIGRMPLHRASSMVSELASVVLLLRYLVKKGDMIIIEEPESHMHPGAQRVLARVLVALAKRGVNILLTTHSDYMFQQIGNLVALSTKPRNLKERLGYTDDDLISPSLVSAYLFKRQSSSIGSVVERLEVGKKGILEGEFGAVAEALFREAVEAKGD